MRNLARLSRCGEVWKGTQVLLAPRKKDEITRKQKAGLSQHVYLAKPHQTYWQGGLCADQENTEQLQVEVQDSHTISAVVNCNIPSTFCGNQEQRDEQRSLFHKHNIITPHFKKLEILLKPLKMLLVLTGFTYNNLVMPGNFKPGVWERGQRWGYQLWCSSLALDSKPYLHQTPCIIWPSCSLPVLQIEKQTLPSTNWRWPTGDSTNGCSLEQGWCPSEHSSTQWNRAPILIRSWDCVLVHVTKQVYVTTITCGHYATMNWFSVWKSLLSPILISTRRHDLQSLHKKRPTIFAQEIKEIRTEKIQ